MIVVFATAGQHKHVLYDGADFAGDAIYVRSFDNMFGAMSFISLNDKYVFEELGLYLKCCNDSDWYGTQIGLF